MLNARDRAIDGLRAIVGVRLYFVLSGGLITRLLLDARSAVKFQPVLLRAK
jgi:peptidoglycan/LPS O-acetylase OafA/YrhL